MTNSKRKGNKGELELANELKKYGYDCRRSQQYNGKAGDADVIGLHEIYIECKRVESGFTAVHKAIEQAVRDSKGKGSPTVFHRQNNKPWLVTMRMEEWINLYERAMKGAMIDE